MLMTKAEWALLVFAAVLLNPVDGWAQTQWERYVAQPTRANAEAVRELTYSDSGRDPKRMEYDLMLLEVQVVSSDSAAVDLAFRLRRTADGHVGELLDEALGRLIRINPRLFLRSLQRQGGIAARPDSLVGNFGDAYVDRPVAQAYERDQRIAALLTVREPSLLQLRDTCVGLLRQIIK